jgi:hypothetical protein
LGTTTRLTRPSSKARRTRLRSLDLQTITVRYHDTDCGLAMPHQIGRHVHPMAKVAPQNGITDRHRLSGSPRGPTPRGQWRTDRLRPTQRTANPG